MRPGESIARTTAAPAPSASSPAVERSSGSVMRLRRSAPTTRTFSARRDSICAVARLSADRKPVQAAPTSIAPALLAPSSVATSGAAFGVSSSADIVATRTKSSSEASTPALSSAMSPASVAKALSRSSGQAIRRSWPPVRFAIQFASIPSRSVIWALATTRSGTHIATAAIPAPRTGRSCASAALSAGWLASSGMSHLRCRQDARLDVGERAPDQALQDLPGANLDESLDAAIAHREQGLAPAHRAHQCRGQLRSYVFKGPRGNAGEDGNSRRLDVDLIERRLKLGQRRAHGLGVKGASDRQRHRLEPLVLRLASGLLEVLLRPREDQLAGGVVVGDREVVRDGDPPCRLLVSQQREHSAHGLTRRDLLHHASAPGGKPQAIVDRQAAAGDERTQLAKRVARDEVGVRRSGPNPERHARAVQRRLGKTRSVAHPVERILADRVHGALQKLRVGLAY